MEDGGRQVPFDERAALEELERIRAQIQRQRAERQALQREFGQWVRSFERPPEPPTATAAEPPPPSAANQAPEPREAPVPEPAPIVRPATLDAPAARAEDGPDGGTSTTTASALPPAAPEPEPIAPPAPVTAAPQPRAAVRSGVVIGGGLILLVGGAMAVWMLRDETPAPPAQPSEARPAPPAADPRPAAPAIQPVPPPASAQRAPRTSELVTIRRVWIRVLADGERVLEREVPADTRLPIDAQKTIVIRTGDAGAVRLSLAGEDVGLLGREGEVVTRTFTVPPR
jgi:hypothetical protein